MTRRSDLEALGISTAVLEARGLRAFPEATDLQVAERDQAGREHRLTPEAATAWTALRDAAKWDGVTLFIVSAFRSVERQIEVYRRKLEAGQSLEEILTVCAPPGYSEHHTGRAVDVGTNDARVLHVEFARTPAFRWLQRRGGDFGFSLSYPEGNSEGYQFEPWHWCYARGREGPSGRRKE